MDFSMVSSIKEGCHGHLEAIAYYVKLVKITLPICYVTCKALSAKHAIQLVARVFLLHILFLNKMVYKT